MSKISDLPVESNPKDNTLIPVVVNPDTAPESKAAVLSDLKYSPKLYIYLPDYKTQTEIDTYYNICKNKEVEYIGFWLGGDYYSPSTR